ncbi:uncharacterized protein LOC125141366 [Tachysurus fulvidraco]|uniref:uncharacterized protein LOC125141366 n=1 Tax=Tachysurus fulvidraco TaxID=1234273 RepID=UPI001FEF74BB|nr:uncharacterized protein LOC125141366 [Tachysurus fulvidraco]
MFKRRRGESRPEHKHDKATQEKIHTQMIEKKRQTGAGGGSTMSTSSDQRPKCFRDIMDLVLRLSDEEWKALSRGMTKKVTRLEFAATCTKIVTAVSSAVVRRLLKPLSKSFGIKAILEANDKLKKMAKSKSSMCPASDASAQRSPMQVSDFICHLGQRIVIEIKGAMLEAIRSTAAGQKPSCSESASSPAEDPITQIDDLSVSCTNEICDRILSLYHSEALHRPGGETSVMSLKSLLEVHKIMKGLEKVVSTTRSSSWFTVSTTSDSSSMTTEVETPSCGSEPPQTESPFSDQFMSKASHVVSEVLLETEQKIAASVSSQTSVPAAIETEPNFLMELAKSTAMEILQKLFCILVSCSDADQSGPEHEQKFLSFAQRIHMDIHKRVFTFICERKQAISEKSKTLLDVCTETDAERDIITENIKKSADVEQFLGKATQVASDILVKRLTSHISTGLIGTKATGTSTMPSSTAAVDLDHIASGSINKVISGVAQEIGISDTENGLEAQVGEAHVSDVNAPYTKSYSDFSPNLQSLPGLEESIIDLESESLPSSQKSPYVPLHLFTVVRNQLKSFFTSFNKSAADDKRTDASALSESDEDSAVPIHISEESSVHKLDIGRSFSDSLLLRRNSMLHYVQFPSELVYRFVEESTKALLQNVLNVIDITEERSEHAAEDQEKKRRSRVRFVVKTSRTIVVKHPKKQKKRRRVPSPSASANLQDASHKNLVFKKARRMLGRFLSDFSKTFFNSSTH